jgi:hypothetical protein
MTSAVTYDLSFPRVPEDGYSGPTRSLDQAWFHVTMRGTRHTWASLSFWVGKSESLYSSARGIRETQDKVQLVYIE